MSENDKQKTYTVQQVAKMLKTNPETVRRWIRDGKLYADQVSRKTGNIITDDNLQHFIRIMPKYSTLYSANDFSSMNTRSKLLATAATAAATATVAMIVSLIENKNSDTVITTQALQDCIKDMIEDARKSIESKQEQICRTQEEIEKLQEQIIGYESLLSNDSAIKEVLSKVNT